MSLKVWVAGVDGTLKNQGLLQLPSPSYNSTSEVQIGKLGKAIQGRVCYHLSSDPCPSQWSIACWSEFTSGYSTNNNLILCLNTSDSNSSKFYLSIINNTTLVIGRGSARTVSYDLPGNFQVNTWYHLAATFDGTTTKLYLNGSLVNSSTGGSTTSALNLTIGGRSTNADGTGATGPGWATNDVRIYDHCLTPQEVKEISKGLVLHYPLNDIPSNNILTNGQEGATNSSYLIKSYTISSPPANGTLCTLTIKMNKVGAGKNWVGIYNSGGSISLARFNVSPSDSEQILQKTFTWRNSSSDGSVTAPNTHINTYVGPYEVTSESSIAWIKIEVGDTTGSPKSLNPFSHNIIQDCSGYNNNGTVTGTLTTSTDTPRYDKCTLGTPSTITTPYNIPDGPITLAFWQKPVTYTTEDTSKINIRFGNCQYFTYSNYTYFTHNDDYKYRYVNPFLDGNWHFIVCQFDGANTKIFIDGSEITCQSSSNPLTFVNSLTMTLTGENVSDFRIYTTALSEDDIKALYQEAAFIDYKGNIGCYQFYEDSENSKELWPTPTSNVTYNDDGSYTITGYKNAYSTHIPIDSSKTFYYDIEYSNLNAGNQFYIGFERYDIDKQTVTNQGCQYITTTKNAELHTRKVGTIAFPAINENPAAFTRLRILNHWSGSTSDSPSDSEAIIHYISLKEVSTPTQNQINKQGQIKSDLFIEAESATVSKYGNITANQLIEI